MTLMLPCDLCDGDGFAFEDDGHIENRKAVCTKCGGKGQIAARTGEVPEASASPDGSTLYADKVARNAAYGRVASVPLPVAELWEGNKPTRLTQLYKHDPDNGVYGDCQRTCLAMMLGFSSPEHVPHFMSDGPPLGVYWDRIHAWLGEMGYKLFTCSYLGSDSLADILRAQGLQNPGIYYMLTGLSPRETNHTVVCLADAIWHDPSQGGGGIIGPMDDGFYRIEVLVPVSMTTFQRPRGHEDLPEKPGPV